MAGGPLACISEGFDARTLLALTAPASSAVNTPETSAISEFYQSSPKIRNLAVMLGST
jgi:hypothetical protein